MSAQPRRRARRRSTSRRSSRRPRAARRAVASSPCGRHLARPCPRPARACAVISSCGACAWASLSCGRALDLAVAVCRAALVGAKDRLGVVHQVRQDEARLRCTRCACGTQPRKCCRQYQTRRSGGGSAAFAPSHVERRLGLLPAARACPAHHDAAKAARRDAARRSALPNADGASGACPQHRSGRSGGSTARRRTGAGAAARARARRSTSTARTSAL